MAQVKAGREIAAAVLRRAGVPTMMGPSHVHRAHTMADLVLHQTGRIVGKVEYREGDGQNITIRPGPIAAELTETDVTLSWTEEDTHGSTAIPLEDFQRYVAEGAIVLDTAG